MDQAAQLISTLGFPIVMAGLMAWYINKQGDRHSDEMENMRKTIEQNSQIIAETQTMINMIWNQISGKGDEDEGI